MYSLLPLALGLRVIDDVIGSLAFFRSSQRYLKVTVTSQLILTPEEQQAWDGHDMDVDDRVAIFRRGLLRYNMVRKSREVA